MVRECEVGLRMRRRRGEGINLDLDCKFDGPGVGFGGVVAVDSGEEGVDGVIFVVSECVGWLVVYLKRWIAWIAEMALAELTLGGFAELRTKLQSYIRTTPSRVLSPAQSEKTSSNYSPAVIIMQLRIHCSPYGYICTMTNLN